MCFCLCLMIKIHQFKPPKDPFYSAGATLALVVKTHGLNFESLHQSKLSCLCELGLKSSFCSAIYSSRVRACIHLVFQETVTVCIIHFFFAFYTSFIFFFYIFQTIHLEGAILSHASVRVISVLFTEVGMHLLPLSYIHAKEKFGDIIYKCFSCQKALICWSKMK